MSIYSIVLYLLTYSVSLLILPGDNLFIDRDNEDIQIVDSQIILRLIFSAVPPCMLASLRGLNVGLDIRTYVLNNYRFASVQGTSFQECLIKFPITVEPLFCLIIFIFAKLKLFKMMLFTIQFLIVFPTSLALALKKTPVRIGMLVFYLIFFNATFGLMRQGIAMAFLLLSYTYLCQRKLKPCVVLCICACLFHISAVFVVALYIFMIRIRQSRNRDLYYSMIIMMFVFMFFAIGEIKQFAAGIIRMFSRRYYYFVMSTASTKNNLEDVPWVKIIVCIILLAFVLAPYMIAGVKKKKEDDDLLFLCILSIVLYLFSMRLMITVRFAEYFHYFLILYFPTLYKYYSEDAQTKMAIYMFSLIVCTGYWWFYYISRNAFNTAVYILRLV